MKFASDVTINNRYQVVSPLGEGGMGIVYQAIDRLNRQNIALKSVTKPLHPSAGQDADATTRIALTNEFKILASLHHPNIIRVLDYGFDAQQYPFFTMALLQNARSVKEASIGQPLEVKIRYIVEILQALAYLHQHGIIHRDLKPDNALVTADGEVKVLDFGLAILRQPQIAENQISGTLSYMAPEILLEVPASAASDLYTVGVMAYELLAGRHPYALGNLAQLIHDIVNKVPDLHPLEGGDALRLIVGRLLAKSPDDRFSDAREVLAALKEAVPARIEIETLAIRESFLQAARFVGRERDIGMLTAALRDACVNQGSVWLIGGEIGVGKSRLLEELRVRALVDGVLVLRGQEVRGSNSPYQLWREPLRRLILESALTDFDASILSQIVPDIDALLDRPVTLPPELDGQQGQQRLFSVIVSLFLKQKQPILLILEDLEWVEDSVKVLEQLMPVIASLPLLVVGTYRHDEQPTPPKPLQAAEIIRLERLDEQEVAELTSAMLGDVSQRLDMLELVKRETEGNAFFLVEVLRELSDAAGSLSAIKNMPLPDRILADGVQQAVQSRLKHLPASARSLLDIAAIVERQIDLHLLRIMDSSVDLDGWLTICSNAAVLDVQDQQWRFAHDRLREGILQNMADDHKRALHRKVAQGLEAAYANSLEDRAARIAEHYELSGCLLDALGWWVRAGKHADLTYAPSDAVIYYRKALWLWEHGSEQTISGMKLVDVYDRLGELLNWNARYDEAIEAFTEMRRLAEGAGDQSAQANAWYGTARAQTYQGDLASALLSAGRAELLAQAVQSPSHIAHAKWMKSWIEFRRGNAQAAQTLAEQVLQLSNDQNLGSLRGNTLNLLGVIHITAGRYADATQFLEKALTIFQEMGDRLRAMTIVNNLGWLAETRGDYNLAFERYHEALALARSNGHRNAEIVYLSNLGGTRVMRGDFVAAEADLRQVINLTADSIPAILSETYRFLGEACLNQGKLDEALAAAQKALTLGQQSDSKDYIAAAWRSLGLIAVEWHVPLPVRDDESQVSHHYGVRACFLESLRVSEQGEIRAEKAKTLRAWAHYEKGEGDIARARAMWQEARSIFLQLGADAEVQRMDASPIAP
jgi:predicted ATPase